MVDTETHVPWWRPARAFPFPAITAATAVVLGGAGLWVGIAAEETTGLAVARLVIGDGNVSGIVLPFGPYTFAANESRSDLWPSRGVLFERGLTVTVTAGTVAGSVWAIMLTRAELARINAERSGEQAGR